MELLERRKKNCKINQRHDSAHCTDNWELGLRARQPNSRCSLCHCPPPVCVLGLKFLSRSNSLRGMGSEKHGEGFASSAKASVRGKQASVEAARGNTAAHGSHGGHCDEAKGWQ